MFNLKQFLTENKITSVSKIDEISGSDSILDVIDTMRRSYGWLQMSPKTKQWLEPKIKKIEGIAKREGM